MNTLNRATKSEAHGNQGLHVEGLKPMNFKPPEKSKSPMRATSFSTAPIESDLLIVLGAEGAVVLAWFVAAVVIVDRVM